MNEHVNCQQLRERLKAIRVELREILDALSTEAAAPSGERHPDETCCLTGQDFFAQIVRNEQLPEDGELCRKVLEIITDLGYASTLVLQHRLELNYRQASSILADLERDGFVGPAPGFRPHKVLPPAYALLNRLEAGQSSRST
ncbi:MAG TPA: DNA translocase FtsK [Blastocatellia bacterium]|jgi:DNA segregation ATPase FtsK/SpoIIIE-like protein|nr:DNA translocase FtsK [Blastocatellia bacterium]